MFEEPRSLACAPTMPSPAPPEGAQQPAKAQDVALAFSRLPVLKHFRPGLVLFLGSVVVLVNLALLIGLTQYFRISCTTQYGVVPSEPDVDVPPALANLQDQGGVTIIESSLVYYSNNDTFARLGRGEFWSPERFTCGCGDDDATACDLASCGGTIPIIVEYEQCTPWAEAFSMATALMVWVNVVLTLLAAAVLAGMPSVRNPPNKRYSFWGFLLILWESSSS